MSQGSNTVGDNANANVGGQAVRKKLQGLLFDRKKRNESTLIHTAVHPGAKFTCTVLQVKIVSKSKKAKNFI